jgi:hypothetical protein
MTAIAKRTFGAMLTAAQIDGLSLFSSKRNWHKFSGFMATITKWLILAQTARAPVVRLSSSYFYCVRRFLGDMWIHPVSFI